MSQVKEQDKNHRKKVLNKKEIRNMPNKEFIVIVLKILTTLEKEWMN